MNESHEDSIEIGVNPHSAADSLCDEFMLEIDPVSDAKLLRQFFNTAPDEWHPLEQIAEMAPRSLPDYILQLLECAPKQIFMRHSPWIGHSRNSEQPDHLVVIANAASMGCNTFLMSTPLESQDTNVG